MCYNVTNKIKGGVKDEKTNGKRFNRLYLIFTCAAPLVYEPLKQEG